MKNRTMRYAAAALMLVATCGAAAQGLNSAYYTNDYKFRHDMNPAFGNDQNYFSVPALGNINVGLHGNFGYGDIVMENPMSGQPGAKKMTTFMNPYISTGAALDGFSKGDNRIIGDIGVTILSGGFKAFGGYNTVEISSKTTFGMSLPYELFEFAKNTGNRSYDMGDISAHAMSYAEVALGHSRQINEKLRVGAKLKFLVGLGRADLKVKNLRADLSGTDKWTVSGQAVADVSVKGFSYITERDEYNNPDKGSYDKINDVDVDGAGIGGFGMAIDLGGVYQINEDWRVNAALLDLGFISWSDNAQAVNRSDKFEFDGFHDISVGDGSGVSFDDQADDYGDQITDFLNLKDNGSKGGRTTGIGATLNLGAEYTLPIYRKLTFGALSTTRIKGEYTWTEGRLSANWTPLSWIDGGVSFAVNSFTTSMGWVLNIHPKGYNFFIGMDHLLGKQSAEGIPLSSNASINLGMSITW